MMRRNRLAAALAALMVFLACLVVPQVASAAAFDAGDLALYELNGKTTTLKETYGGTRRVVIVGRPTCSNTTSTIAQAEKIAAMGSDITFIVLDNDGKREAFAETFSSRQTSRVRFASPTTAAQSRLYYNWAQSALRASGSTSGNIMLPFVVLINENNQVVNVNTGLQTLSSLLAKQGWSATDGDGTYHTVEFNTQGGPCISAQQVKDGSWVIEPEDPEWGNHIFAGWYYVTQMGLVEYDFTNPVTDDLWLIAEWADFDPMTDDEVDYNTCGQFPPVTVTFDSQGGSKVASQAVEVYKRVARPSDPVREGYVFVGWYTTADGNLTWDFEDDRVSTDSMTLYARWKPVSSGQEQKPGDTPSAEKTVTMYRLYNQYTGEHLYTSSASEKNGLAEIGWTYEGVGWVAPASGDPVYRLFNRYNDDHHYTTSAKERDSLVAIGWTDEGVGWYSGGSVPVLRQFNPYAVTATHNYTTSKKENDALVKIGWRAEGTGWYAVSAG